MAAALVAAACALRVKVVKDPEPATPRIVHVRADATRAIFGNDLPDAFPVCATIEIPDDEGTIECTTLGKLRALIRDVRAAN